MTRPLPLLFVLLAACAREAPPAPDSPEEATSVAAEAPAAEAARAELRPVGGSGARGTARLVAYAEGVRVEIRAEGLRPGLHGVHVHAATSCAEAADGPHFDPGDAPHGDPEDPRPLHHAGDLGNLRATEPAPEEAGGARLDRVFSDLALRGPASVVGRVLVIHEGQDDLNTQPDGGAGAPVACGVIEPVR